MVDTFLWVTMVIVGLLAVVVGMYMLSAYRDMTKKEKAEKKKKFN